MLIITYPVSANLSNLQTLSSHTISEVQNTQITGSKQEQDVYLLQVASYF